MTTYTLLAGNNNVYNLSPGDTISGLLANLNSTDTINGAGQTLTFTNSNTVFHLTASQFGNVNGIAGIKVSDGPHAAYIQVDHHMASQNGAGGFTVDASGDTGATTFAIGPLTGSDHVTILGGTAAGHQNLIQTDAGSLNSITFAGVGTGNSLQLSGGGNANLSGGNITGINTIVETDSAAYTLTLGNAATGNATAVTLNGNADDVVYGSVDTANIITFGAAGQTAIGGVANDQFITTAADFSPFYMTTINGGGGTNTLKLTGGGTYYLENASISNIQKIAVTGASNVSFNNYLFNYLTNFGSLAVTLDNSSDQIDLRDNYYYYGYDPALNLTGGNGNNIIWLGSNNGFFGYNNQDAYAQTVTLGTGANTVIQGYYYQNKVNGGTGTTTTNTVGNNSVSTLVYTSTYEYYGYQPQYIYEANTVVGFHAIDLGFNDSNLSFFGGSTGINVFFYSDASFVANNAAGVVVYGTINGGDTITLNATDQSYIAGGDAAAQAALHNIAGGNTVYLNAGGLTAAANGTELIGNANGGVELKLFIDNSGVYNFNAAGIVVSGFKEVDVGGGASVNLLLNSNGGLGYTVDVKGGTVTDTLVGAAGTTNAFIFDQNATVTGTLNGGGAASTVDITNFSTVDLTNTAISNISKITIDTGSTLVLTSDQVAANNFLVDPGTLEINVSAGTSTLFISDLTNLSGFDPPGTGTIIINDNGNGDTIYAGPGTEVINLGTGNDWVNAGSGNDTINASAASGQSAVIIVGDADAVDTVNLGSASVDTVTFDTVLGYAASLNNGTGSTTVNIVGGNPLSAPTIVDFSQEGATASLYNINELVIGGEAAGVPQPNDANTGNAEAIFTIEQLTSLGGQEIGGFTIQPDAANDLSSILKIVADKGPGQTNTVNNANLYTFSGTVDILVTQNGTGPLPLLPVTTDVSGITSSQNVIVDQGATTGYNNVNANGYGGTLTVYAGTGVEDFNAGQGSNTIVFNHANAAYPGSVFTGNGGTYTFDINQNTDLTGSTFNGGSKSVTAVIAAGMTGKVNASDVDTNPTSFSPNLGFFVTGGASGNDGTLYIVDNLAAPKTFEQNNIGVILTQPDNASYIDEVIDGTGQAGPLSIDLTITSPPNSNPNTITVNGSAGGNTIQAGTGTEILNGGAGNDTFNFDEAGSPFTFGVHSRVNGNGGSDTLNVGDSANANVDFTAVNPDVTGIKTVTGIENFNIGNGIDTAEGKFWEYQLADSSSVVTVNAFSQVTINVDGSNPTPHELSLAQVPVGPIAVSSSFELDLGALAGDGQLPHQAAVVVNADNAGDIIDLGYTTAAGPVVVEVAYDGAGNDTIVAGSHTGETDYVVLGAGGVDTLYSTTNSTVIWQFESRGGSTDSWDTSGPEVLHAAPTAAFLVASDLFDSSTYVAVPGSASATIEIGANTDLTGATFIGSPNAVNVDAGESVVFTDTQLAAFAAGGTALHAATTTSGLVVDVTGANFTPTFTPDNFDLKNWTGSLTLVGTRAGGQTFDLSAATFQTENFGGNGALYIYGAAGSDTAIFNGGATGAGTHGGVLDLGGGSNTLSVTGTTDFTGGATPLDIEHVGTISLAAVATPGNNTATFTYQQIVNDEASNGGSVTLTSAGGIHNYAVVINGAGNMDLSHVLDTGYLANIPASVYANVVINDANIHSATVRGTDNAEAFQATGSLASADIISVAGLGDTVIAGKGSDLVNFRAYNVANDYQFRYSDLGTATGTNTTDLAAEGDIIIGIKANFGYADISGFAGVKSAVATAALTSGANLGVAGGFGTYGVEFDSNFNFNSFITGPRGTGELIQRSTIAQAASDIEGRYSDSATNQGFIGVWDKYNDLALFYVNHTGASAGISASQVQLVGVFDTANGVGSTSNVVLPSTFFHIHTA